MILQKAKIVKKTLKIISKKTLLGAKVKNVKQS